MPLWTTYYTATSLEDAIQLLDEHGADARIVAGATDMIVELHNGTRSLAVLIDVTRVGGLSGVRLGDDGLIHLGPMVTHAQAAASELLQTRALPLAQACWGVGGPALRNRGTIAGNVITGSPASDTITALRALDAQVTLQSAQGERTLPLAELYTGVRATVLAPNEMLVDIAFPPLAPQQQSVYLKLRLRRVLSIAVTNVALVLARESAGDPAAAVTEARIALGSVAPTVIRAPEAEAELVGHPLTDVHIAAAARRAAQAARPIDDVRGSAEFRRQEIEALVRRDLEAIRAGETRLGLPEPSTMVQLWGKTKGWPRLSGPTIAHHADGDEPIQCVVNGQNVIVEGANGKTLLRMLREDLGLTGAKPGCEAGECGACTIWLDGIATLACLTPAPRAHGARITTVEGLTAEDELHPVQQAFIEEDAVQCGYCTPGFVMSSAKLLQEVPRPTRAQIKTALSGNLCRCTGYYKIITAVEKAAAKLR
jgi:carbon-monoxide dehydrogenase medium subunit